MLEFFSSGLIALGLEMAGVTPAKLNLNQLLSWEGVPLIVLPADSDRAVKAKVEEYLKQLASQGRVTTEQDVGFERSPRDYSPSGGFADENCHHSGSFRNLGADSSV
jgi:hypothetical protein